MNKSSLLVVGVLATFTLAACQTGGGTGSGNVRGTRKPVAFTWESTDSVSGGITATFGNGEVFKGNYFQITRDTRVDRLDPLWDGWGRPYTRTNWRYWDRQEERAFIKEYSGRVLANLRSMEGDHMRCRFTLISPSRGMAGGGEGRCQLSETGTMKIAPTLAWLAALAFLASWFLPVLDDVPGWMAFRYALAPMIPYSDAVSMPWDENVPQVLSALTNVVFVILFGLWVAKQMFRPGLFVRITLACLVLNLYWFVKAWRDNGLADLLYGYYVWQLAFALLLAVAVLTAFAARRTSRTPTDGRPA